jgi:hypothetical protein
MTELDQFKELIREYEAGDNAVIWDVHISDQIIAPDMRDNVDYGKRNEELRNSRCSKITSSLAGSVLHTTFLFDVPVSSARYSNVM